MRRESFDGVRALAYDQLSLELVDPLVMWGTASVGFVNLVGTMLATFPIPPFDLTSDSPGDDHDQA
jgi:hypothetical protein